jgi:hypothetical protein
LGVIVVIASCKTEEEACCYTGGNLYNTSVGGKRGVDVDKLTASFTGCDLPPPRDILATEPLGQARVF